ncbi:helix-turn-helix domain-containing protein [Actinoplanes oblitus]|uniref:Helix-turn-helix domain-containing protein n=1 Tax=Actinoplanes oblitus TaxID=3040509 RepID=A0ABY8WLR5_9ACTN|nr:helix-turn-helix domain-containing protein [Actinoplanes oblitus]WIM98809.1 helix-turn-helix domain-containing protein [Actinoplanes oblitus]
MTPVELILLGRALLKIGEQALPEPAGGRTGGERAVVVVMSDIYAHDGTTVTEVARRTGLPQSAVSGAVARLRTAGSVLASPDPADRRRQLLHRNPELTARRREVAAADIAPALTAALAEPTPAALTETLAALETLNRHLTPAPF